MPAWFPLPPHPLLYPSFSFRQEERPSHAASGVRVGSVLGPRCAKNLIYPCGEGRCGRRVCMYNTTHNSTYLASPRQPAYILGDGDSYICMPAWLRLPQGFSFPTKLLGVNPRSRAFPLPRRAAVAAGSWPDCELYAGLAPVISKQGPTLLSCFSLPRERWPPQMNWNPPPLREFFPPGN